ncbi:F0F1 ATP synthase subunit epsilon [Cognatishimia sp. MH4019]|uniref:F0F1 ATP synthase subunit epsilon n=1 Tax=Cognatishimia sp. MH4019 TaxID=2854030 RepID=UPI001CD35329|nr:F0F1 ATP synthase subunit epsilon [Cognatishimia sp. MH4019]
MADTMQFDLVSPERKLASVTATEVQIPGADGDMTAMPDHSPVITTLRPGVLTVTGADGTTRYAVTGGFAEVTPEGTSVLAERAMPADEVTADVITQLISDATEAAANAADDTRDAANKLVADMEALRVELGV